MDYKTYNREILGRCANCGQERAVNSKWYCADCLQKMSDLHHARYQNMTPEKKAAYIKKVNAQAKARKEQRRKAGLCVKCCKPSREGKDLCAYCADKESKRNKEAYMRKLIAEESSKGEQNDR